MYYKSIINFRYENYDIINDDCFSKFRNTKVQTDYYQCLKEGVIRIGDSPRIPDTKEVFCQKIVETPSCFMNFIKENCNNTAAVKKVVKDYIVVVKNVCKTNKAVQCGTFKPFLIVTLIYLIKLLF
ncbi:uncharacterized protein LOC108905318 [Anoplophora glabripennis]|uniref:uncharacterized protein LOC108905318 n=1 Tax=Anoplophora glabripennis TaxID=217634 RepID=UPI00087502C4|nr:uncharacterized protein LOC108905318 [Anoplophora glabripennis]